MCRTFLHWRYQMFCQRKFLYNSFKSLHVDGFSLWETAPVQWRFLCILMWKCLLRLVEAREEIECRKFPVNSYILFIATTIRLTGRWYENILITAKQVVTDCKWWAPFSEYFHATPNGIIGLFYNINFRTHYYSVLRKPTHALASVLIVY